MSNIETMKISVPMRGDQIFEWGKCKQRNKKKTSEESSLDRGGSTL